MQFINKAYLLIGGNVGNVNVHLHQAVELMKLHCGDVVKQSGIYKTAPWGNTKQDFFLNQAIELHTGYTAPSLMSKLLDIEQMMGRIREEKYGPRIIDLDILLFNQDLVNMPELVIPHPEMQNRRFALAPLSEIAGPVLHPLFKQTIQQLLSSCKDNSDVERME